MLHHPDQHTPEAVAKRQQRKAWDKLPGDPLERRAKSARYWTEANKTNPLHGLVHARTLFRHPGFTRYLMPSVRAHIEAKNRAHREQYARELREQYQRYALKKALAKNPTGQLFTAA